MSTEVLIHSGSKGMKWYHRRYQNYDGSLTSEGRIHYGVGSARGSKKKGDDFEKIGYVSRGKSYVNKVKAEAKSIKDTKDSGLSKKDRRRLARAEGLKSEANDIRQNVKVRATKQLLNLPDGHPHNQFVVENNIKSKAAAEILDARAKRLENKVKEKQSLAEKKSKLKALEKEYGALEDQLSYGKKADSESNKKIMQRMSEIENEHRALTKGAANYGSSEVVMDTKYKKLSDGPVRKAYTRDQSNAIASDADKLVSGYNSLRKSVSKSRDLSQYSDAELQKIVNRQQLEQRYNQLNPDKIDKGSSILRESIQTAGAAAGLYASYKIIKNL